MKLSGLNMLGSHNSGIGQKKYKAINPATLGVLDTEYIEATPEEIDRAVNMASEAFDAFRERSYKDRASFLEAIATEIMETGDSLIERCMEETALPEARLTGERMRTVNQLKLFASVLREGTWLDVRIDMAIPDRQPVPRPDIRQMRVALGPVGIFGASNFPLAFSVAGGDTTSALAAGCPVIVKAHPLHPGTSELVARAIKKAIKKSDMPDGIFSMIHGASKEVGMALVNHPEIRAVGFTGSFKGGKALFDSANARNVPIPVFAEMGSVNPVFILPNAMKERGESIAQGMLQSFTLGAGQFCTNPGLTCQGKLNQILWTGSGGLTVMLE
jgi:NADP-dependent aldehyde dehydrogenase